MTVEAPLFELDNLCVGPIGHDADGNGGHPATSVVRDVCLVVNPGEVHAVIDPVGSRAAVLASTLLGSPKHEVLAGSIRLWGDDVTDWGADVRAKAGMFLAFQNPQPVPGVGMLGLMAQAVAARSANQVSIPELHQSMVDWMQRLGLDPALADARPISEVSERDAALSELLQMAVLEPDVAIIDQTSAGQTGTGLALDAVRAIAHGIREVTTARPALGVVLLTHDQRLVNDLQPDHVHVMADGRINSHNPWCTQ